MSISTQDCLTIPKNSKKYLKTNKTNKTNICGIFATSIVFKDLCHGNLFGLYGLSSGVVFV